MTVVMELPATTLVSKSEGRGQAGGQGVQWTKGIEISSQWAAETVKKVLGLTSLPHNWDSYGSPPPSQVAIFASFGLLNSIPKTVFEDLPLPFVAPVSGGGIQLDWNVGTRELELHIMPDGSTQFLRAFGGEVLDEGPLRLSPIETRALFAWLTSTR